MSKYIDADRFERVIMSCGSSVLDDDAAYTVIGLLNDEAPANVEPVKRGKWIEREHLVPLARDCEPFDYDRYDEESHSEWKIYWHCNCCNYEASRHTEPKYNYCPNCGARMDE